MKKFIILLFVMILGTPPYSAVAQTLKEKSYDLNVPFSSQSPFGDWSDLRQENACEETSAMMAVDWARGETFTKSQALSEILKIANWEKIKYGSFLDTSAEDTVARIFNVFFNFQNVSYKVNPTLADIKNELSLGHVVIVPVNGQIINNPYYTSPGPAQHMILIKGYDSVNKKFITNDAGTRHGANFEYPEDVLYKAIRDYASTGKPEIKGDRKVMIVVWR